MTKTAVTASRVLWAIDPLQDERMSIESVAPFIKCLSRAAVACEVKVFPTYILAPGIVREPVSLVERLKVQLGDLDFPGLQNPVVMIEDNTHKTKRAVCQFLENARNLGITSIVIRANSRRGIARNLVASFTDELLAQSAIPVIVLGDEREPRAAIRRIFFPTDFSVHSKNTFREVVEEARCMGAEIVLFHSLPRIIDPLMDMFFPIDPVFFVDALDRQRKRAQAWARWASREGVSVETRVDNFALSVSDSIVQLSADHQADLIVMSNEGSGSITKHVLRDSNLPVPVWVFKKNRAQGDKNSDLDLSQVA